MENYFMQICGSSLWNSNWTYSDEPDLPFCLQYSLLTWFPCFLYWVAAPVWIIKIMQPKLDPVQVPVSWLFLFKMLFIVVLCLVEMMNLALAVQRSAYVVYYMTPCILFSCYLLSVFLTYLERKNGYPHSTVPFLFWLLLFLVSLITLRSKIIHQINKTSEFKRTDVQYLYSNKLADLDLFNFYIYFACLIANMILFSQMENRLKKIKKSKSSSPDETASLLSMLTFWWINRLINIGFKRTLTREDLFKVDEAEKSHVVTKNLEHLWNPKAAQYIQQVREIKENKCLSKTENAIYKKENVQNCENLNLNVDKDKAIKSISKPSLALCLIRIHFFYFFNLLLVSLVDELLTFARPILLDKLITFVKDKDQKLTVGLFYVLLLSLKSVFQSLLLQHGYHMDFLLSNRLKTSLMNLIFKKSLKLSPSARKSTTIGEMTNLITTNTNTFENCTDYFVGLITMPIQLALSIYMLWTYLGIASIAGFGSMIVFLPLTAYFTRRQKKIRLKKYQLQDSRIKTINESISGIRVIKFMGWEKSFQKTISIIRGKEISNLIRGSVLSTLSSFVWSCVPFVVAVVSFATFILIDEKNNLDPNTAFVSLTLFNMLRQPLNFIPTIINGLTQLNVSMTRIQTFLLRDEINEHHITHQDQNEIVVNVKSVDLGWSDDEITLKNLTFDVNKGQLIAILGKVGSGKSSLLSGLLGEMHKLNEGHVNVNGSTAYVPQQAWIQNSTLRDNILFGVDYDERLYDKILNSCALKPDLDIMPAGDQTEIGEKGINLSGGQKQRISLARAVYSTADIYILDDPLSAVDSHVAKHIFDNVIGPDSILKDKTRLFVTNSLSFLPQVDKIIMLEEGSIVEMGTYEELRKNESGQFNEFIRNYLKSKESSSSSADIVKSKSNDQQIEIGQKRKFKRLASTRAGDTQPGANKNDKIIEKEKVETGMVKFTVILEYFKACRLWLSLVFLFLYLLSYAFNVRSNFWLSDWTNDASVKNPSHSKYFRVGIYALLGFCKSLIAFSANVCFVGMYVKAAKLLHDKLLDSVLRGNLRFFDSTPIGRIVNRFSKDVETLEASIPHSVKSIVECFLDMSATLFIISSTTPLFLIALVPIAIFYIFVQRYFIPSNRQLKRMHSRSMSPIFSHFGETQVGVSTVRAYKAERRFIQHMQLNIDENFVFHFCDNSSNRWLSIRLEIIGNLITILAATFAIIQKDTISAGLAGLSISISMTISRNLKLFVRMVSRFEANITAVERIKEYFNISHEAEWNVEQTKPDQTWPQNGTISMRNYFVKYRDDLDWVLKDLNIRINAGEKVGIVGRTGAGKSSLALALFRMLELSQGEIVVDEIKIGQIGLHDLRHKITIIPQDAVIFSGSIRMNLDPFDVYTDDQLWTSLELAHMKQFVMALDKKLDFECSEGGSNLSAGQRQLICLARAILRKTRILVLDEATASIDHNTDELIQQTIRKEFKDCTVLTIAHRLNTILDSSRIIVLSKGQIVEFDTPQILLANENSVFYSMAYDAGLVK